MKNFILTAMCCALCSVSITQGMEGDPEKRRSTYLLDSSELIKPVLDQETLSTEEKSVLYTLSTQKRNSSKLCANNKEDEKPKLHTLFTLKTQGALQEYADQIEQISQALLTPDVLKEDNLKEITSTCKKIGGALEEIELKAEKNIQNLEMESLLEECPPPEKEHTYTLSIGGFLVESIKALAYATQILVAIKDLTISVGELTQAGTYLIESYQALCRVLENI